MDFDWDQTKANANFRKHGITFEEAETAFADENAVLAADPDYPDRIIMIAFSRSGSPLVIVFVQVEEMLVRVISARPATRAERKRYEEED